MRVIKIRRSDKNQIYKLALEEGRVLQKFASFPIYRVRFNKKLFDKLFSSYFKKNHFFYGIKKGNVIVAMIAGYIKPAPNGNVGYINNMMVSKKHQRKSYSKILRNEVFKLLKKKRIKYCQLDVLAKNKNAIKIYKKWGFVVDGFQMTKRL